MTLKFAIAARIGERYALRCLARGVAPPIKQINRGRASASPENHLRGEPRVARWEKWFRHLLCRSLFLERLACGG